MPKIKKYVMTSEQEFNKNRWDALDILLRKAGFSDDAFAYTEFSIMPFFEIIIEECAKIAEIQAGVYTGENRESSGCYASAFAIRNYGKMLGNMKV